MSSAISLTFRQIVITDFILVVLIAEMNTPIILFIEYLLVIVVFKLFIVIKTIVKYNSHSTLFIIYLYVTNLKLMFQQ